jgi:hypothetical protein
MHSSSPSRTLYISSVCVSLFFAFLIDVSLLTRMQFATYLSAIRQSFLRSSIHVNSVCFKFLF